MYYKLALRMLWCRGLTNWNRVLGYLTIMISRSHTIVLVISEAPIPGAKGFYSVLPGVYGEGVQLCIQFHKDCYQEV